MKKTLFFSFFLAFFYTSTAQNNIPRANAVQSKATSPSKNESADNTVSKMAKGTIFFNENGGANKVVSTKTSGICSIYMFESVSEAEAFAYNLKKSDLNILDFYFTGIKDNLYYFSFSLKEPRDIKWYLNLFKNNNLTHISYNNKVQTIDQALSK